MGRLTGPAGTDPAIAINQGLDRLVNRVPPGILAAAAILGIEWKTLLLTPGRGRIYGTHQASAPGDPPAPEFYDLQKSIHVEELPTGSSDVIAGARVGSDLPTAEMLEFGTLPRRGTVDFKKRAPSGRGRLGSRLGGIAPRPHARPALTRAQPRMTPAIIAQIRSGASDFSIELRV